MKKLCSTVIVAVPLVLSGCGTLNSALMDEKTNREMFHVVDIKTDAGIDTITGPTVDGLGKNVNDLTENYPIPPQEVPKEPGRFTVEDPFEGTNMSALAKMSGGMGPKTVECDGAVWTGKAIRDVDTAITQVNACLWQYQGGYHLDFYMAIREQDVNFVQAMVASGVEAALGSPEEWANQIVLDTTEAIASEVEGAQIALVQGRPELDKEVPWMSQQLNR